jgi:hypothetical protein
MDRAISFECETHGGPFDCPDSLVHYTAKFDEYGIIVHDGGSGVVVIHHCPWCGQKLPESKRQRWFTEIDALGLDPRVDDVPAEYQTDAWFRRS